MSIGSGESAQPQASPAGQPGFGQPPQLPSAPAPEAATGSEDGSQFAVTAPTLTLPKGGGAIRGIGEKFAANPVTGTGSMTVPIATSPGRSGFGPELSLSYDSGSGNGAFGFGWTLALPPITPQDQQGLAPVLDTTTQTESDVFILSGAEDLVPVLDAAGQTRRPTPRPHPGHVIHRYRPRIEGLFARIERWTRIDRRRRPLAQHLPRQRPHPLRQRRRVPRIADPADAAAGVQLADQRNPRRPR